MTKRLAILGAGCAGLSLAIHLSRVDRNFELTLVDQRTEFGRDRTWAFWPTEPHPFEDCVQHRWNEWSVRLFDRQTVHHSQRYPYSMIPSDAFYDFALDKIHEDDRMNLVLDTPVRSVDSHQRTARIHGDDRTMDVNYVFDSRPSSRGDAPMYQHFKGWFVKSNRPVFNPNRVRLMDFWKETENGVHFMYQLPTTKNQSLFEATWISGEPFSDDTYESYLRKYLEDEDSNFKYEVLHEEAGAIPLSLETPSMSSNRVIPIGSAGGATRASTGYTFLGIQRSSRRIARAVTGGSEPGYSPVWSRTARFLDSLFLSFLERHPDRGPRVFFDLFQNCPPRPLVRFLSDRAGPLDYLNVMNAMPKKDMIREFIRTIGRG